MLKAIYQRKTVENSHFFILLTTVKILPSADLMGWPCILCADIILAVALITCPKCAQSYIIQAEWAPHRIFRLWISLWVGSLLLVLGAPSLITEQRAAAPSSLPLHTMRYKNHTSYTVSLFRTGLRSWLELHFLCAASLCVFLITHAFSLETAISRRKECRSTG